MTITASPLCWPAGWQRTESQHRSRAKFGKASRARPGGGWDSGRPLTIAEATARIRQQLERMDVDDDDLVISTNLQLRLDGLPRSNQGEPRDPGAAVYWLAASGQRCMAIDRYDRVADNLAAIAATLDAMRAIERHGGAQILERAFTGFTALPDHSASAWSKVLQVAATSDRATIEAAYRRLRSQFHPDKPGGDRDTFNAVQRAWEEYLAETKS